MAAEYDRGDGLLQRAAHEIRDLRRRNEILSAQMLVVEAFHAALIDPPRNVSMTEDIAWAIDRHLEEREKERQTTDAESDTAES